MPNRFHMLSPIQSQKHLRNQIQKLLPSQKLLLSQIQKPKLWPIHNNLAGSQVVSNNSPADVSLSAELEFDHRVHAQGAPSLAVELHRNQNQNQNARRRSVAKNVQHAVVDPEVEVEVEVAVAVEVEADLKHHDDQPLPQPLQPLQPKPRCYHERKMESKLEKYVKKSFYQSFPFLLNCIYFTYLFH